MGKIKPAEFWLKLTVLSAFLLFVVFFQGVAPGGLDVAEACELGAGQTYDHQYRSQNAHEQHQLFPLTTKCNAEYDLVPPWTNPALAILAILTASFFGAMLAALVIPFRGRFEGPPKSFQSPMNDPWTPLGSDCSRTRSSTSYDPGPYACLQARTIPGGQIGWHHDVGGRGGAACAHSNLRMDFGNKTVINDLSFEVRAWETFGFLGSNGSGKTTTLRALLGIYQPTAGTLHIGGKSSSPVTVPGSVTVRRKEPAAK